MITKTPPSRLAPVIGAIAITVALAACSTGVRAPTPSPSDPPAQPTPAPVSPAPSAPAPTGVPAPNLRVDLESTSGQDVTIDILDRSRSVVAAKSGSPGEGVTADSASVRVENIDERALRLTWADFPIDNELTMVIDPSGSAIGSSSSSRADRPGRRDG